jgi:ArsR family transcriptional regulator, arsenate/arsenite/antimonite-responsive transcriptional repressor
MAVGGTTACSTPLSALSQQLRLRVFRELVRKASSGLTPGELASALDVPSSTLSFHLKELMHAGLVVQERESRNLIYRPSLARMNALLAYLTAHCCAGEAFGESAVNCLPR